ncbi:MAG TPA: 7-cyano-7-deazaguanine synthase [Verrucomicrobiota bacterium]|nr:7-cyano-7-deazaguanine synthase [Verrucomicrobiota bacterium]
MGTGDRAFLFECGGERAGDRDPADYLNVIPLDWHPETGNVNFRLDNISEPIGRDIPDICLDMLEIGAYVYSADQAVSRGGPKQRRHGSDWYRNFELHIPVRRLDIWTRPAVQKALSETLNFLSDDRWDFKFAQLTREIPINLLIDFNRDGPWFPPDEVMLFSGGLDSLAGAVDGLVNHGRKLALVSHRSVAPVDSRQREIVRRLQALGGRGGQAVHIPVWVNRRGATGSDTTQRARSFLYAMLAAAVAIMHDMDRICFYENGITSINLAPVEQVVGARASRTTHPRTLHGYARLLTAVTGRPFEVDNPYFWKTKSDIVRVIKEAGQSELVGLSKSCTHTHGTTKEHPHCGVCSQCVDRRISTAHNELETYDPGHKYVTDIFNGPLPKKTKPTERTMVESLIRHNRELEQMDEVQFWTHHERLSSVLPYVDGKGVEKPLRIFELLHRHARQVGEVINAQIRARADAIRLGQIDPDSLLGILTEGACRKPTAELPFRPFPTPEGAGWEEITIEITSRETLRVTCRGITKSYSAYELGFVDRRKTDRFTNQWRLLEAFAAQGGQIYWESNKSSEGLQKAVRR